VTTAIVEQLPIPREDQAGPWAVELSAAAATLTRGHDAAVFARLNAVVARLYELSEKEMTHVLGSFPLVARAEREAMLEEFRGL